MPTGVYERTEEHYTKERNGKISKAMKGNINSVREKNGNWKGGFKKVGNGYILFKVPEGCKFSSMKDDLGYIRIHRLVMAEYLQRPLKPEEVVHHINGDITDNKIENLRLFESKGKHHAYHYKLRNINEGGMLI